MPVPNCADPSCHQAANVDLGGERRLCHTHAIVLLAKTVGDLGAAVLPKPSHGSWSTAAVAGLALLALPFMCGAAWGSAVIGFRLVAALVAP